jgi:cytochrome c peroxidase
VEAGSAWPVEAKCLMRVLDLHTLSATGVSMSLGLARLLAGGMALAAVGTATLAGEPSFFDRQAMVRPQYPERSQDNAPAYLGQKLFFDTRLSRTGRTACASCHHPTYAYAEPRRVSVSDDGILGRRNAPSLINAGFLSVLMWDGRFRTLEQQALSPFDRGEMGISAEEAVRRVSYDPEYVRLFHLAFDRPPTEGGVAQALAAYQRTLVSGENRIERFLRTRGPGLLSRLEHDGLYVFDSKAACSTCHRMDRPSAGPWQYGPMLFTDMRFHNLGVGYGLGRSTDTGRYGISGVAPDLGAFRTPSLRNVARTAPYMHDGSLTTLEEVVEFYDGGGRPNPYLSPRIRPLFLSGYEKAALVAFLRALTDPQFEYLEPAGLW